MPLDFGSGRDSLRTRERGTESQRARAFGYVATIRSWIRSRDEIERGMDLVGVPVLVEARLLAGSTRVPLEPGVRRGDVLSEKELSQASPEWCCGLPLRM